MSLIELDLATLDSVRDFDYDFKTGYLPVSLEQLEEHVLFEEIQKLLNAINPEFNSASVFNVKCVSGVPDRVFGFSVINENGKLFLTFGVDVNENIKKNIVSLTVESKEVDEETINVFKAGKATVDFRNNEDKPQAFVKYGKTEMRCNLILKESDTTYNQIANCETLEQLAGFVGNYATFAIKLTDLVRPFYEEGCKGQLKTPLQIELLNWDQPSSKDFGKRKAWSTMIHINCEYQAKTEQGQVIERPKAAWLADSQTSFKQLFPDLSKKAEIIIDPKTGKPKKSWVQVASEEKMKGGKIILVIASFNIDKQEGTLKSVNSMLKIIPGKKQPVFEVSELEIYPETITITSKKVKPETMEITPLDEQAAKVLASF